MSKEPQPNYFQIGDHLVRLGEYVKLMPRDASMPHLIEPTGNNEFQIERYGAVRLPTYEEIVSAINRLREDE
ncbi:MAG: hypothetical protein OXC00_14380 [Acidimicrobiaceae bacterium]|nr:hypothetical protein [Acidimicrobiaceae bacterium]